MGDTQIGEWLRAKQELKTAEEQPQELRVHIEAIGEVAGTVVINPANRYRVSRRRRCPEGVPGGRTEIEPG
jgi:hypothetical protein